MQLYERSTLVNMLLSSMHGSRHGAATASLDVTGSCLWLFMHCNGSPCIATDQASLGIIAG